MTPFTQFLGRLVELVGAENAAQLTRDFAGQKLQFPITDHYGDTIDRLVTNRLSIHYQGVAYDVSHLPNAAVGEVITVNPASLPRLDARRFVFGSGLPHVRGRDGETNQIAADLQAQLHGYAQTHSIHRDEAARPHLHASEPGAAVSQAPCGAQANQRALDTQSELHPFDPANVDRS